MQVPNPAGPGVIPRVSRPMQFLSERVGAVQSAIIKRAFLAIDEVSLPEIGRQTCRQTPSPSRHGQVDRLPPTSIGRGFYGLSSTPAAIPW